MKHLTLPLGDFSIASKLLFFPELNFNVISSHCSFLWKQGERVPTGKATGEKTKQLLNQTEKVYKSNSAVKCVDERGTMKVRVNLSHKSSFPAFSSPSACKSHQCTWMAPKEKICMKKCLGYHSINTPLGKEPKFPQNCLTSYFSEQEEKHFESYYYSLEKVSAMISSHFFS